MFYKRNSNKLAQSIWTCKWPLLNLNPKYYNVIGSFLSMFMYWPLNKLDSGNRTVFTIVFFFEWCENLKKRVSYLKYYNRYLKFICKNMPRPIFNKKSFRDCVQPKPHLIISWDQYSNQNASTLNRISYLNWVNGIN